MRNTNSRPLPKWFWAVAALGLVWNVFGIVQFLPTVNGSVDSFTAGGMTRAQAELYVSLPAWMTVCFGVGVFGGTAGCISLLWHKALAKPVFAVSLLAYGALYIGDMTHGVFAAFGPPQVVILTMVLAIAAGLLWVAWRHTTTVR